MAAGIQSTDVKKHYNRQSFKECGGAKSFENWKKNKGLKIDNRQKRAWELLKNPEGKKILDFGSGRGELAIHAAQAGNMVYAMDYAPEAIKLTKKAVGRLPAVIKKRIKVIQNNSVSEVSKHFKPHSLDAVFLLNVLDHLGITEGLALLLELKKALKTGGKIIARTCTNTAYSEGGYKYYTRWAHRVLNLLFYSPFLGRKYGPDGPSPRNFYSKTESLCHITEFSEKELKNLFRFAGFNVRVWYDETHELKDFGIKGYLLHLFVRPTLLIPKYFSQGICAEASLNGAGCA